MSICPIHIYDSDSFFVMTVRPIRERVILSLGEICEPNGSRIKLSQVNYMAFYATTNKKLISLYVTPTSYNLLDISRPFKVKDDDELYKHLVYEA